MVAFTSIWSTNQLASSDGLPVKILTTPAGRSEEFNTSAKVTEQSGLVSEASTTQVFPPVITGAITDTRPSKESFCGAITDTTPMDSGTEKLKCELATGLTELNNCWNLSHHPA